MENNINYLLGHRDRLKERFIKHKDSLQEYELLELLLFYALPRKDVKPLAKELLNKFGNLKGVLNASENDLLAIKGLSKHSLVLIQLAFTLTQKVLEYEIQKQPIVKSWKQLLDHCFLKLADCKYEKVYLIYLNTKNFIIKDEIISEGSLTSASADVRKLMQKCLNLGASSVLIAHNHPSGLSNPSKEDILMTKELFKVGKSLNVYLYDHLIVSKGGIYSFRENNLINDN